MTPTDISRKLETVYERIVRQTQQTVIIHDDEEFFAKIKADLANPYELCCLCGEKIEGYGNNPAPLRTEGHCCDDCNIARVIPARFPTTIKMTKEAEERKRREKAEAKRLAEATRADREELERKKKAEALAKKTAEEEDRLKNMDEGKLKAFLKTIPARPAKTIRNGAGCIIDQTQKQKQWDEKWGQYKKYLK